jgi:hypothetical protein
MFLLRVARCGLVAGVAWLLTAGPAAAQRPAPPRIPHDAKPHQAAQLWHQHKRQQLYRRPATPAPTTGQKGRPFTVTVTIGTSAAPKGR